MHTKVGPIAFKAPEYIVAQILSGESPDDMKPVGFSIFGPGLGRCEPFPTLEEALAEARRRLALRQFDPAAR